MAKKGNRPQTKEELYRQAMGNPGLKTATALAEYVRAETQMAKDQRPKAQAILANSTRNLVNVSASSLTLDKLKKYTAQMLQDQAESMYYGGAASPGSIHIEYNPVTPLESTELGDYLINYRNGISHVFVHHRPTGHYFTRNMTYIPEPGALIEAFIPTPSELWQLARVMLINKELMDVMLVETGKIMNIPTYAAQPHEVHDVLRMY